MVAMLGSTEVEGKNILKLVEEGKISQKRLNEIIDRTKKGGAEIVKYLEKGSAFMRQRPQVLRWLKVI